jgi:hypothetical protein
MKTSLRFGLIVPALVLLTATGLSAPSSSSPYPPVRLGALRIEKGMTRAQVRAEFGEPAAELSANIWAYYDLRFLTTPAAAHCDAMVLTFEKDRVVEARLCSSVPVREFVARMQRRAEEAKDAARK